MKRVMSLLYLAVMAICPVMAAQTVENAGPPPTTTEVMKFFEVMHVREQSQTLLLAQQNQIKVMVGDMFKKQVPDATPEEQKKFQAILEKAIGDIFANYPIDDILRDMVPVYQKHLTESDLNAVVAFYSSPVGQKLRREMPAMTTEAMRVSYARLQPKIEEMMTNMAARIKQLAAEGNKENTGQKPTAPRQ